MVDIPLVNQQFANLNMAMSYWFSHEHMVFPWLWYVMLCYVLLVYQGVMVKLTVHSGQSWPIRSDSWWRRLAEVAKVTAATEMKVMSTAETLSFIKAGWGTMCELRITYCIYDISICYLIIWYIYIYTYYICIYIMYIRCIDNGIDCISDTFHDFQSMYLMLCICTCTYT